MYMYMYKEAKNREKKKEVITIATFSHLQVITRGLKSIH